MKKLSFFDKLIFVVNAIAATLLLLSYILPYVPPKTFLFLSVLGLGVPLLTLLNVLFFVYWLLKIKKQLLLSLMVLIVGYIFYGSLYKFSLVKEINKNEDIKVMNFNVRLFNLYNWIEETDIDFKIMNFLKSQSPDILCIQEYHPDSNVDLSFFKYRYDKLSGKLIKHGQVILSQYPIINSGSVEFPIPLIMLFMQML